MPSEPNTIPSRIKKSNVGIPSRFDIRLKNMQAKITIVTIKR